jgi:hypothetical protein
MIIAETVSVSEKSIFLALKINIIINAASNPMLSYITGTVDP